MKKNIIPAYIKTAEIINAPAQFNWNYAVWDELLLNKPEIKNQLSPISFRGILAFSLGSAEWIIWRLSKYLSDDIPFQVIEAAWAGIIDWLYLKSFKVPDWSELEEQLPYNVGSSLDLTFWLLKEAFLSARRLSPFWENSVSLSELAIYILNTSELFNEWRQVVIKRLTDLFPKKQDKLGIAVPREVLDPKFDYQPNMQPILLQRFLHTLDYKQNPYLRSPQEMIEAGFKGTPYLIDL